MEMCVLVNGRFRHVPNIQLGSVARGNNVLRALLVPLEGEDTRRLSIKATQSFPLSSHAALHPP